MLLIGGGVLLYFGAEWFVGGASALASPCDGVASLSVPAEHPASTQRETAPSRGLRFMSALYHAPAISSATAAGAAPRECAREHECPPGRACPLCGYFTDPAERSAQPQAESARP